MSGTSVTTTRPPVSSLNTDNLLFLNDSLTRHVRHQRHSQHHRNNKATATTAVTPPLSQASAIESSSSALSSPEMSPIPLSSISSLDDMSDISTKTAESTPSHNYSSSSSSSLSTIVPTSRQTPRTMSNIGSPLLRKKSGELLKSSLRLPDLHRSHSMPNSKSVRFATNLEKVKLFEKGERPIAVSTENSPVLDHQKSNRRRVLTSWEFDSDSSDSEDDYFLSQKLKSWKLISSNVRSSFTIDPSKIVQLMRVSLNDKMLIGSIFVKNVAFDKHVALRISIDDWKSIVIIQSNFKRSVNNQFDEFEFELNVSSLNFKFYEKNLAINLCVEYTVNGSVFWDNNFGNNYKIVLERLSTKSKTSSKSEIPKLDYFKSQENVFGEDDDNDVEEDNEFDYRLKPKNNQRYTFDFNNKYTFNDSILSPPVFEHLENVAKSEDALMPSKQNESTETLITESAINTLDLSPLGSKPQFLKSAPNLSDLSAPSLTLTASGSPLLRKSSSFNDEDEYHRLIRNYCYAFS